MALPAYDTKSISTLSYQFLDQSLSIEQRSDGISHGTALWLAGQILAAYMIDVITVHKKKRTEMPTILDLGSGTGLTGLAVASLGCRVLVTDTKEVVSAVLHTNVETNAWSIAARGGAVECAEFDWSVDPQLWDWDASGPSRTISGPHDQSDLIDDKSAGLGLQPPFDYILSADTVYDPTVSSYLLCAVSKIVVPSTVVYLCFERRDPVALDAMLAAARNTYGFNVDRVPSRKVRKSMIQGGLVWRDEDWEGVEIWKLKLKR